MACADRDAVMESGGDSHEAYFPRNVLDSRRRNAGSLFASLNFACAGKHFGNPEP
jgi:energy-converting hydrogenase Eha subunit B